MGKERWESRKLEEKIGEGWKIAGAGYGEGGEARGGRVGREGCRRAWMEGKLGRNVGKRY